MKILNLKYKMHRLVNLVFYLIIFIFGFLLGFSAEKIDFSKLISEFLFIDSANAYTLDIGTNFEFDEEYIYNQLSTIETFNLNDFPYIHCYRDISVSTSKSISCYALNTTDLFHNKNFQNKYTSFYVSNSSVNYIRLNISYNSEKIISEETKEYNSKPYLFVAHTENSKYFTYTNYDLSDLVPIPGNVLDFSSLIQDDNEPNEEPSLNIQPLTQDNLFYNISKNIVGDLDEENYWIYDLITILLIIIAFLLLIIPVSKVFKFMIGGYK